MGFLKAKRMFFLDPIARAKRHYFPGYIWHITHRCHKRDFLLKFSKERHRYLQWLYEPRKRYGLTVLEPREGAAHYQAFFEAENEDIGRENTYLWDIKGE
jgi:REP element-mobilizing transposase RayT